MNQVETWPAGVDDEGKRARPLVLVDGKRIEHVLKVSYEQGSDINLPVVTLSFVAEMVVHGSEREAPEAVLTRAQVEADRSRIIDRVQQAIDTHLRSLRAVYGTDDKDTP